MDSLRASLEAAIPATPPTSPRGENETDSIEPNGPTGYAVPTSTAPATSSSSSWTRIKETLALLDPEKDRETVIRGMEQLRLIFVSLNSGILF